MEPVVTLTLNPALDVTTRVGRLRPREKLRCREPRFDPGGGGVNVARVIRELGGESTACVVLGGATGEQLRGALEAQGVAVRAIEGEGDTRITFQVFEEDTGDQFRFVLPGPRQDEHVAERILDAVERELEERAGGYLVASGSLPPGLPEDMFARIATVAGRHRTKMVLDTAGPGLEAAEDSGLYLIKPDLEEARALAGSEQADPEALAVDLVERSAAEVVIISLGEDGALLATSDGTTRIASPKVERVSTVGAGDSFVGGLVLALAQGRSLPDACRYASAAGAAAVLTPATELVHRRDVERLHDELVRTSAT